jgi:PKD repeat protein
VQPNRRKLPGFPPHPETNASIGPALGTRASNYKRPVRCFQLFRRCVSICFTIHLLPQAIAFTPPLAIEITTQTANTIQYRVFNPVTQNYVSRTRNAGTATISSIINSGGVLVWLETRSDGRRDVWLSTWLPSGWAEQKESADVSGFAQAVSGLQNLNGVVCWLERIDRGGGIYDNYVFHATCDPVQNWRVARPGAATYHGTLDTLGLTTHDGVVAWRDSSQAGSTCSFTVRYSIYNPISRGWQSGFWTSGSVSCLAVSYPNIVNATVQWTRSGTTFTRGYIQGLGWGATPTTTYAYSVASSIIGNPPLSVWFIDMSIGASGWSFNFGDSGVSSAPSPVHIYSSAGVFTAVQTVTGSSGTSSFRKSVYTVVPPRHPADNNPADNLLVIGEVTAYGAAWKQGVQWPIEPNPIPVDYVTRAGTLWVGGEHYSYSALVTTPPNWWINSTFTQQASDGISAIRHLPTNYLPGVSLLVTIDATPSGGVFAHAVQDRPPAGWDVSDVNEAGHFDSAHGQIKWGVFFDAIPRTLSYHVTPSSNACGTVSFTGEASADGSLVSIEGEGAITATAPLIRITLSTTNVNISWPSWGNGFTLQAAENLGEPIQWLALTNEPLVVGNENTIVLGSAATNRFFRLSQPCSSP